MSGTRTKRFRKYDAEASQMGLSDEDEQNYSDLEDRDVSSFEDHGAQTHPEDTLSQSADYQDQQNTPTDESLDNSFGLEDWDPDEIDDSIDNIVSDSSDDEEDFDDEENRLALLKNELSSWIAEFDPTRRSVNHLLLALRNYGIDLPKDKRTLLGAARKVHSSEKCGGNYLYFGLKSIFSDYLSKNSILDGNLQIKINVDGLPLFKSSAIQLWPILVEVNNDQIYVACLFSGSKKPEPVEEYLSDFIAELDDLQSSGFSFEGHLFNVFVIAFLCDTPARAFLKSICGHTAYYSCERCIIRGTHEARRMTFPETTSFEKRDNEQFKAFAYKQHQKLLSPLCQLSINMIDDFPLDYMHLVCLGVMRRILNFLKKGPPICRVSANQIEVISNKLLSLKRYVPSNFARKPRSLAELDRWKATEYRQFLLYTGPVVLKGLVSKNLYEHFLLLHVSMRILLNENDAERNHYVEYARELLKCYVENCSTFYSRFFNVYNVHGLLHIADDAINKNCSLNNLSCFQFENYLQTLKRKIRNGSNPIAQIAKKIEVLKSLPQPRKQSSKYKGMCSTTQKDKYVVLRNGDIAIINNINQNSFECDVFKSARLNSFFNVPCESRKLGIYVLPLSRHLCSQRTISEADISRKAMCLPYDDNSFVVFPLLNCV